MMRLNLNDKLKKILFTTVLLIVVVGSITVGIYVIMRRVSDTATRGKGLNQRAWEASFRERSLPVPPKGPREGYWGARLGSKVPHDKLGWIEPPVKIPSLLDVDERGFQYFSASGKRKYKIMILGGSVAFGAYASKIQTTYFNLLGRILLEKYNLPADIIVLASGAWKSIQEVIALSIYGKLIEPDLVIFLNGLNDLTNGATSKLLYGQRMETSDGSKWTPLYHAHDYEQRVKDYLYNMKVAAEYTRTQNSDLLIILQPSLAERKNRTVIEDKLLSGSLKPHSSKKALTKSYEAMRQNLLALSNNSNIYFLDCSRLLNNEKETTFADIWHFSDPGQIKLAYRSAQTINNIVNKTFTR